MSSVYIETSVVSYLTARLSNDLLTAARQKETLDWWDTRRSDFDLYSSELVWAEASRGDPVAAKNRLAVLESLPILSVTTPVEELAAALLDANAVPRAAKADAVHISIGAVREIDFLLTWNHTHIDNAETKPLIRRVCRDQGHRCPEICTPAELMGEYARKVTGDENG